MFLKRIMGLSAAVLIYVVGLVIFFEIKHAEMENDFRAKREKYHVDRLVLTAAETAPSPAVRHVVQPASDTNTLIGPMPPAAPDAAPTPASTDSSAPTTNAAPDSNAAPATPDSNAVPTTPPTPAPSTMDYRRADGSSVFQMAAFRPADAAALEMASPNITVVTNSPAVPAPAAPVASESTAVHTGAAGEGSVIVLLYHQFKPAGVHIPAAFQWTMNVDVFESEMKYIHDNGYNVIPMDDLIKFIKHEGTVPPKAVVITIDDGYKSAIVYAAPILKQYNYPWTFFVYPEFLTTAEGPGAASWRDLAELQTEGIDIESHSMTHPNLKLHRQKVKGANGKSEMKNLSPDEYAAWLKNETAGSKALIEQKLGKPVTRLAYPYGEYNKQVEQAAIDAGYEAIFTVADNPVHATTSLHSIGRYTITQSVEKDFAAYLRQGALGLASADPAPGATITNPRPVITATLGYPGTLDPKTIETSVREFGVVKHDFDPATNTVRLYLPHDLIQPAVMVSIRVEDAQSKKVMVANWHFNYEPANGAATHTPIGGTAPAKVDAESSVQSNSVGTPLDAHPVAPVAPAATH